jgi:hypothetical protein
VLVVYNRYNALERSNGIFKYKKIKWLKLKKINEVYGGPFLILVHLRHLELKSNGNDHYN